MHPFSFCPNPACPHHQIAPEGSWYVALGFYYTKCFGDVPRYRCKTCGRTFSSQTFSLDYFAKKRLDYRQIERLVSSSMSQRALSRHFKVSLGTINNRIQLPSLGLVGDVVDIGPMYTQLNQVGGAVGSEEAVNRPILIPNAMLFSQVAINYTARQDAAFILDEVVIRITYDTDWDEAEQILLNAARAVTSGIMEQTGQEPYVRADMYDYGVYMRLRYMTQATERPRITYEIIRRIFQDFQRSARVDFAIPYIYSFRKGVQATARHDEAELRRPTVDILINEIDVPEAERAAILGNEPDIDELIERIREDGLVQPVVLTQTPEGRYRIVAGHMRIEACKRLGWRSVPAIVRPSD